MPGFHSYADRSFLVTDPDARLRLPDLRTIDTWGAVHPPGVTAGAFKVLPRGKAVVVRELTERSDGKAFARVEFPGTVGLSGWTSVMNLERGLAGETLGLFPDAWDAEPDGVCFTVTDPDALIRGGGPTFAATGGRIPAGTYVRLRAASPAGAFVEVVRGVVVAGLPADGTRLGWTARSNLTAGWSNALTSPAWFATDGGNARWQGGKYLGPAVLARLVGSDGEVEYLTLDTLVAFQKLADAAKADGLTLAVNSGFRTWGEQAALYDGYVAGRPGYNRAAPPGRSNHQNGQAIDLNTEGFQTPIYAWLAQHGPRFGFVRTVSKEHWHWEHRPEQAAALALKGRHKVPGVAV